MGGTASPSHLRSRTGRKRECSRGGVEVSCESLGQARLFPSCFHGEKTSQCPERELEDALVRLPVIYRTAVVLHDAEGMTVAEIADVQGVGLPAAKQRLRRGRMILVDALAQGRERRDALRGVPLRCWDARSKVSDYIDGELLAADRVLVERHLEACPTCPPLYAGLVGTQAALGALRDADTVVPILLADRIKELLRPE